MSAASCHRRERPGCSSLCRGKDLKFNFSTNIDGFRLVMAKIALCDGQDTSTSQSDRNQPSSGKTSLPFCYHQSSPLVSNSFTMKFFSSLWSLVLLATANAAFVANGPRGARGVNQASQNSFAATDFNIRLTGQASGTALFAAKKKKAAAKKKATPESFKKSEFVAALADRTGVSKKDAEQSLQCVLDIITEEVGSGKKIAFPGFGSFTLKERAERKGRNPQTGEELTIPASKSPSFSASKTWKDAINGKKQ